MHFNFKYMVTMMEHWLGNEKLFRLFYINATYFRQRFLGTVFTQSLVDL